MKLIFSSVIVLIFLGLDFSSDGFTKQNEDLSFLIGLMNDYGGKPFLPNHPKENNYITNFYSGQSESLEQFKLGILKVNLKMEDFEFIEGDGDSPITRVYSSKYSKLFNSYYKFKKSDDFYYDDEALDKEFLVKTGMLKKNKFKQKHQKKQFLKGCFIRNGVIINDQLYEFRFSNSSSKYKLTKLLCKDLHLEIVKTEVNKKTTPASMIIHFKPKEDVIDFKLMN